MADKNNNLVRLLLASNKAQNNTFEKRAAGARLICGNRHNELALQHIAHALGIKA